MSQFTNREYVLIAVCGLMGTLLPVISLECYEYHSQAGQYRSMLKQADYRELTVRCVDFESGEPLSGITTHWPSVTHEQLDPMVLAMESFVDPGSFRLLWVGVEPVRIPIGSRGYETQETVIGPDTPVDARLELRLKPLPSSQTQRSSSPP